jgi:hypothetical protein
MLSILPDVGTNVSTFPDLDDAFAPLTGIAVLAQSIARSLEDARYGVDLCQWLNESLEDADIFHLQQTIEAQGLADERLQGASVSVTQPSLYELRVAIVVEPSLLVPFRQVLKVTSVTVEVLAFESSK